MTEEIEESTEEKGSVVAFDVIPQLAANGDFIEKTTRLRELQELHDKHFKKGGEYDQLKLEVGAMVMVTGYKSVAYHDLRITNADGGKNPAKLTGAAIMKSAEALQKELSLPDMRSIVLSAVELDPAMLVKLRISAALIEHAKASLTVTRRAGSVRVSITK